MEWKEDGGPAVSPPSAEGFGLLVIRQSVTREANHEIDLDYAPAGLRCRLAFELPGAP
jgi:two-component sensor histidine kinase